MFFGDEEIAIPVYGRYADLLNLSERRMHSVFQDTKAPFACLGASQAVMAAGTTRLQGFNFNHGSACDEGLLLRNLHQSQCSP